MTFDLDFGLRNTLATRTSRRALLRGAALGGAGLAVAALIGCGGDDDDDDTAAVAPAAADDDSDDSADDQAAQPETEERFATVIPWPSAAPKKGGVLPLAIGQQIGSFDTTKSGAIGNLRHTGIATESLLGWGLTYDEAEKDQRDVNRDVGANLAESWELTPDGLTYVFSVRPGVKWHNIPPLDGRAFTAGDVRYAYERYAETGVWQELFAFVKSWEVADDLTLSAQMARPSPDFIVPLAEQNAAIFSRELVDNGTLDTTLIGTGPFIMEDFSQSEFADYVRNPDHWGPEPYLDGLEMRIMPDAAARLAAYRAEQVAVEALGALIQVEDVLATNPGTQIIRNARTKSIFGMVFNQKIPKWQDVRVRRAIHLALDRDEINTLLYDGLSETLPIIPWNHVFDVLPTAESGELGRWWRYDPDEAMKLLQAAGAEELEVDFLIYRGYLRDQNDVWVDHFRRVGIDLKPRDADYVEFNSQLAGVSYKDAIGAWDIHGTQADNYFRNQLLSTSSGNWHNINDPEIDVWAEQQSVELDPAARREIHRKIWDKVLDDVHRVEHTNGLSLTIYQPWLHGMQWRVGSDGLAGSVFGYNNSRFIPSVWMDK